MFVWFPSRDEFHDSINNLRMEMREQFRKLRKQMAHDSAALIQAFNDATDEVGRDLEAAREEIRRAVADKEQAVKDAVEAALSGFDAPLARLQALGANEADPVPGTDTGSDNGGPVVDDGTGVVVDDGSGTEVSDGTNPSGNPVA